MVNAPGPALSGSAQTSPVGSDKSTGMVISIPSEVGVAPFPRYTDDMPSEGAAR